MRTPNADALAAVQHAVAKRQLMQRMLMNLIVFVLLILPICVLEFGHEPAQRGFFCGDESLAYPYKRGTVSIGMLIMLLALVPLCVFVAVEALRARSQHDKRSSIMLVGRVRMRSWLIELGRHWWHYNFGLLLVLVATEVGKFTMGRLRPHFLAVCQPVLDDGSSCSDARNLHRYVEHYSCAATGFQPMDLRQARLSFPSGHASLSFYAAIYVCFYLHRKLTWRIVGFARYAAQFVFLMLAWYVALTRIMDHWHHWSDVVIGTIIGVIGGLITVCYIAKPCAPEVGGNLRRQDTIQTLHEDCSSSTPPSYVVGAQLSDEQFCTKV